MRDEKAKGDIDILLQSSLLNEDSAIRGHQEMSSIWADQ
jgi:hypothetical protein